MRNEIKDRRFSEEEVILLLLGLTAVFLIL